MPGPSKLGAHIARPESWGIVQKDTGTVQFDIQLRLLEYKNGQGWEPIDTEERATGYFNLIQKNGEPNQINVEMIKTGLGWAGDSISALNDTDWSKNDVQVWIADELGNDQRMHRKVKYINPKDYQGPGGGIEKADATLVQSLDARYGPMLRALSNGKNGGAGRASATATRAAVTSAPAPAASPASMGKDVAWSAFERRVDEFFQDHQTATAWDKQKRVDAFKALFTETYPGRKGDTLTPAEWASFKQTVEKDYDVATESIIPF